MRLELSASIVIVLECLAFHEVEEDLNWKSAAGSSSYGL